MFRLLSVFSSKNIALAAVILAFSSFGYGQYQKMRYNAIVSEYELFKQKQADLVAKIEQLNALKAEYAEKRIIESTIKHQAIIESIKNEYNRSQNSNIATINNLRNELRSKLTSANKLPDFTQDTSSDSEIWRERYGTVAEKYETLVTACQITTNDFNELRLWADVACEQVGCE